MPVNAVAQSLRFGSTVYQGPTSTNTIQDGNTKTSALNLAKRLREKGGEKDADSFVFTYQDDRDAFKSDTGVLPGYYVVDQKQGGLYTLLKQYKDLGTQMKECIDKQFGVGSLEREKTKEAIQSSTDRVVSNVKKYLILNGND